MPNIANISGSPVLLRDDDAEVVEILPGEAAQVKISKDHPSILAHVNAGLIVFGGTAAQAEKVARERAPAVPGSAAETATTTTE